LTGASLSELLGDAPGGIVAFRYDGGWTQIPVQIDERKIVDFGTIYDSTATGFTILTYADAGTFTGGDPDPTFDADDELVLMGREAGTRAVFAGEPAGVLAGSGLELAVTDPLTGTAAYAYLFLGDGSLFPNAGAADISYDFVLLAGDYKTHYDVHNGPNPENSMVTTSAYSVHFADRWICGHMHVTKGGASGVDILDRRKALFAPGNCTRSENTFSNGEGAFIVNRKGPVRALRGYVGANSGPTSHRIHAFYEEREDVLTMLRVHPIPGIVDFFDYSPAATGMTYRNNLNLTGVTIDGNDDAVTRGPIVWEMVSGLQGTLAMSLGLTTNIPGFRHSSYYLDDSTPLVTQCTGDNAAYGSSGIQVSDAIPNTDPALGAYSIFEASRVIAYGPPSQGAAFAEIAHDEATHPLTATAAPYDPGRSAVADGSNLPGADMLQLFFSPNPFRGPVRIRFSQAAPGTFSVSLHDVTGRLVAKWVEGTWESGVHEVVRDATGLPAGIYLARARDAAGGERTVRVVHIK
jgi:hypothetical protein